eukprot:g845.t1
MLCVSSIPTSWNRLDFERIFCEKDRKSIDKIIFQRFIKTTSIAYILFQNPNAGVASTFTKKVNGMKTQMKANVKWGFTPPRHVARAIKKNSGRDKFTLPPSMSITESVRMKSGTPLPKSKKKKKPSTKSKTKKVPPLKSTKTKMYGGGDGGDGGGIRSQCMSFPVLDRKYSRKKWNTNMKAHPVAIRVFWDYSKGVSVASGANWKNHVEKVVLPLLCSTFKETRQQCDETQEIQMKRQHRRVMKQLAKERSRKSLERFYAQSRNGDFDLLSPMAIGQRKQKWRAMKEILKRKSTRATAAASARRPEGKRRGVSQKNVTLTTKVYFEHPSDVSMSIATTEIDDNVFLVVCPRTKQAHWGKGDKRLEVERKIHIDMVNYGITYRHSDPIIVLIVDMKQRYEDYLSTLNRLRDMRVRTVLISPSTVAKHRCRLYMSAVDAYFDWNAILRENGLSQPSSFNPLQIIGSISSTETLLKPSGGSLEEAKRVLDGRRGTLDVKEIGIFFDGEGFTINTREREKRIRKYLGEKLPVVKTTERRYYTDHAKTSSVGELLALDLLGWDIVTCPTKQPESVDLRIITDVLFFCWRTLLHGHQPVVVLGANDGDFVHMVSLLTEVFEIEVHCIGGPGMSKKYKTLTSDLCTVTD